MYCIIVPLSANHVGEFPALLSNFDGYDKPSGLYSRKEPAYKAWEHNMAANYRNGQHSSSYMNAYCRLVNTSQICNRSMLNCYSSRKSFYYNTVIHFTS